MKNNYCVYRHIRLDTNQVFYIGIGLKERPRRISGRNEIWNRITTKTDWYWEIMLDNLTRKEAEEKEIEFVKLYGRLNTKQGTLANMTDGGEGATNHKMSDEAKEKIRQKALGRKFSDEHKKKIKESNIIFWNTHEDPRIITEQTRKKLSLAAKGRKSYNKGLSKYNYIENRVFECFKIGYSERQIQLLLNISKGGIYRLKKKYNE
jgi:hypothetical protein